MSYGRPKAEQAPDDNIADDEDPSRSQRILREPPFGRRQHRSEAIGIADGTIISTIIMIHITSIAVK